MGESRWRDARLRNGVPTGRPRRARRALCVSLQRARLRASRRHHRPERQRRRPGAATRIHRARRGARARARLDQANRRARGLKGAIVIVDAPTKVEEARESPRVKATHADRLVIFGITGDLARVMTFRSLYRLGQRGLLGCPIVGVAVDAWWVDELIVRARESIAGTGEQIGEVGFRRFEARLAYVSGDFADGATYERVADALDGEALPVFY